MLPRLTLAFITTPLVAAALGSATGTPAVAGDAPTIEQALGLAPVQARVDYTRPARAEIARCTLRSERRGQAWVVSDPNGQVLRRFSDSNADKLVDVWSYYKDGVEVYRDIDSDFDKKPDQYRWFHTGGTRWGVDSDADGTIDQWRSISAYEVAEELFEAIRSRDEQAFRRLLITEQELKQSGLGATLAAQFRKTVAAAPSAFNRLAAAQKGVTNQSRFVDFGAGRPGVAPAGVDSATRDVVLYESASALVETGGTPEQIQLGAIVAVGGGWRLVEAPQVGSEGVELANVFTLTRASLSGAGADGPPSEQMQQLMSRLEKLDTRLASASPAEREKLIKDRAQLLRRLAAVGDTPELQEQWYSQLADMLSAAVVEGAYPAGVDDLAVLLRQLQRSGASESLKAHVRFQSIWSEWGLRSQDPKQDYAKVQEDWLKQLKAFATAYPSSPDTAEALLQLGMADEFAGKTDAAKDWYRRLAGEFSSTPRGRKAAGAIRRLNSIGKPIAVDADALTGGRVRLGDYRGKYVLIQYWATWCEPCKADMAQIKQLHAKYAGRGFAVLGVNLDSSPRQAEAFVAENPLPWKHAYDEGGLDGRLATELGVMTLPLMVLVDDQGRVVRRNIHVAELDGELKRLIR
ncbi:MAG: redoxin domain-containing protein [Planctomycetota bacterium]